jgi:hypothetical protein
MPSSAKEKLEAVFVALSDVRPRHRSDQQTKLNKNFNPESLSADRRVLPHDPDWPLQVTTQPVPKGCSVPPVMQTKVKRKIEGPMKIKFHQDFAAVQYEVHSNFFLSG